MNDTELTDLLSRFRLRNDHDAFHVLYQLFEQRIWAMILAKGVPHGAAGDVFQEVCISMARYLGEKEVAPQQLAGTVFTIIRNRVFDFFRARVDKHVSMDELLEEGIDFSAQDETGKALENRDLFEKITEEAGLNGDQKEALLLHYLLGYKLKDIADLIGIPTATIKTRIFSGKKAVRALLVNMEVQG